MIIHFINQILLQ